jgi:hypothetical protein
MLSVFDACGHKLRDCKLRYIEINCGLIPARQGF